VAVFSHAHGAVATRRIHTNTSLAREAVVVDIKSSPEKRRTPEERRIDFLVRGNDKE
jgi:hypothetical protein